MGELGDKLAIKVRKPKKRANTFDRSGGFPFFNGGKLDRIHFDLSLTNNHAEEFNARYIKGTFGKLEGQSMFTKAKKNSLSAFMEKYEITLGVNA